MINYNVIQIPAEYKYKNKYKESPIIFNIREDNAKILGMVSQTYKLVDHKETIYNVQTALEYAKLLDRKPKHSIINNGAKIISEFILKDEIMPLKNDKIKTRIILNNSYDGSLAIQFLFGLYRLVCSNGLMIGVTYGKIKYYHRQYFNLKDFIESVQENFKNYRKQSAQKIRELANKKIKEEQGKKIIETICLSNKKFLPKKLFNPIFEYFKYPKYDLDKQKNLWTLYNAFTYILTREKYNEQIKNEYTSKVFNIIYNHI